MRTKGEGCTNAIHMNDTDPCHKTKEFVLKKSCVQVLTDGGDVRRVKFVVRESAQQTCFPNPRISEEQESEEHIVLLSHGVDARCDG